MNGNAKFFISIALALLAEAAGVFWWASHQASQIRHNDFQIQMISKDVEKNSIFVRDWPSGKYGSGELPSDTRQDLKIQQLESAVQKLSDRIFFDPQDSRE
jgi:hypothetical protein|tara:strand:- start:2483 stop:2785 length:303 start_codon:yes stop_codon:yes gene_type:complete